MKFMVGKYKNRHKLSVSFCFCCGLFCLFTIQLTGDDKVVGKQKQNSVPQGEKIQNKRMRDPFSEGNGLSFPEVDGVSYSLSVAGIIIMESGVKLAAINLPGGKKSCFCKEHDILEVATETLDKPASNSKRISLKIIEIKDSGVLVAPVGDLNNAFVIR